MVLLRRISIALTAAVAALGSALFIAWNYFYRRRVWSPEMDYYRIPEEEQEHQERQVLVLGLDGARKSSVLQGLSGEGVKRGCGPTRGFNFMSLNTPACQLDFLEIGGCENLRSYWVEYLRRVHILVYVVDSADRDRLPLAKEELHRLLRANSQLPLVVLGNKQDQPEALGVSQLHDALALDAVGDERRSFLLAVQLAADGPDTPGSLQALRELLLQLVSPL
ncbi:ADP-ribosylation factor-like 10 [Lepisosteus oculatus]|uniref:ADP-ribosylation factor-like 10 n=1 Tax=Lepisosteus oculatus TaxID=7918 RepID=UPI0035F50D10